MNTADISMRTETVVSHLSVPLNVLGDQQKVLAEAIVDRPTGLPSNDSTRSFWMTEPWANPSSRELDGEGALPEGADICIIGSGISGVSVAYHLATKLAEEPGTALSNPLRVVILDAREFCSGATGRNGGHLTASYFEGFVHSSHLHGEDDALRELYIQKYTVEEILKVLRASGHEADVDLVSGGHIDLYFTEPEVIAAKADYDAARAAGADMRNVDWLGEDEVFKEYGADYAGVRFPGHNLWPLKLVGTLYDIASKKTSAISLGLHTRTPVTAISPVTRSSASNHRWSVSTPKGNMACNYIVHATNAYVSHLLPHMQGSAGVIPTRGQVIALRANAPLETISKVSWAGNEGFEYWFPRPVKAIEEHPLIILGGGRELRKPLYELYETDDSVVDADISIALQRFLPCVFPKYYQKDREPEMEWTGIMGFTKTGDPFVGPVVDSSNPDSRAYDGQYVLAGYSGHGMPRAFACAEAVAGMLAQEITGKKWEVPPWLPLHYLTKKFI